VSEWASHATAAELSIALSELLASVVDIDFPRLSGGGAQLRDGAAGSFHCLRLRQTVSEFLWNTSLTRRSRHSFQDHFLRDNPARGFLFRGVLSINQIRRISFRLPLQAFRQSRNSRFSGPSFVSPLQLRLGKLWSPAINSICASCDQAPCA
jgi:hypothetical protein